MESDDSKYDAVFHFRDAVLYNAFMDDLPGTRMRDHLRNDQPLRNRCFPGFRITNDHPTDQQIRAAFKKEIVERNNGGLATRLCSLWIHEHPALTRRALNYFEIETNTPASANTWIDAVHSTLDCKTFEQKIQGYVRHLWREFTANELLIFASIICYGKDQTKIRNNIERELDTLANDPDLRKNQYEKERAAAQAKIEELMESKTAAVMELEKERQEFTQEIEHFSKEYQFAEAEVIRLDDSIAALTEELKRLTGERQALGFEVG